MERGQRRWIPDPATFNCMGLNAGAVQAIADSEWKQIPQGAPYPSRADGALLQGSGPQVYVMAGLHPAIISHPAALNGHSDKSNGPSHMSNTAFAASTEWG